MFWQDLDPGYYQNPAGVHLPRLRARCACSTGRSASVRPALGNVTEQFDKDPGEIWVAARTLAAVLCMAGVRRHLRGRRRLWGVREGLIAAAVLAFAFLPVAYSRVAVTDVGSLAGVALALLLAVRAAEDGRTRDYVLAGAAAGLAVGVQVHGRAGAAAARDRGAGAAARRPLRARSAGLALGRAWPPLVVFALLNPYLFGSLGDWWSRPARPGRRGRQRPQARARSRAAWPTTSTA